MAIQTEGRRLALHVSLRPQLDPWLVGWLVGNQDFRLPRQYGLRKTIYLLQYAEISIELFLQALYSGLVFFSDSVEKLVLN
jgi:hypothetical protein